MSETEQTRVVAILDDMFFASKIREAAKSTNITLDILKNNDGIEESIKSNIPRLIIVDLNSNKLDALQLIKDLKSSETLQNIPTLGYLPHVEEELKRRAIDAGFDVVLPRSRFSRELVSILEKTKK